MNKLVMPWDFRWSTSLVPIANVSCALDCPAREDMGSTTTMLGRNASIARAMLTRWNSRPARLGRVHTNSRSPLRTCRSRSMPIERMLRRTCFADSSKARKRHRSPRRHPASTKEAARLVFPEPGVPVMSTLLPR